MTESRQNSRAFIAAFTPRCPRPSRLVVAFIAAAAMSSPAVAQPSLPTPARPALCKGVEGYAEAFAGRRTFLFGPDDAAALPSSADAALYARADAALLRPPRSVMDKTTVPPSGDRHDYTSLAPYWWPDPANPAGPFIRHDGEANPERKSAKFDGTASVGMSNDVWTLSLAYLRSGKRDYAAKAALLVRTWFLDPATRMNPNMTYAQAVPGVAEGRAEGVLDTTNLLRVIDAVGLIGPSGVLPPDETAALEAWFGRYIDWMQSAPTGKAERAARNNHGIWYDAQITAFALFARRPEVARSTVLAFPERRLAVQFALDGSLPAELVRTRSFHYSLYALRAAYDLADLASCVDYDLWNYVDREGRSIRKATEFVARYRDRAASWPYPERSWPAADLDDLLERAGEAWGAFERPGAMSEQDADAEPGTARSRR